jgi:hypothetical protein
MKDHHGQRRLGDIQSIRPPVMRFGDRMHAAGVANPTSPVQQRIAVQHLAPKAATRRTNALAVSRYGREVEHEQQDVVRVPASADEAHQAALVVVAVDPLEATLVGAAFVRTD